MSVAESRRTSMPLPILPFAGWSVLRRPTTFLEDPMPPLDQALAPKEFREASEQGHSKTAAANAYNEVFDELKKMSAVADKATGNSCPEEQEIVFEKIAGVDTASLKDTPYGKYLDQLKDDSLVLPDKAPDLDEGQQRIADQALNAVRDLVDAPPGSPEWRRAMQDLRGAFSTRQAADPTLTSEYFKGITDYITLELAKTNPDLRFGTSSVSGAVVAGFKNPDGKFQTFIELRNEIVCPPNPYK